MYIFSLCCLICILVQEIQASYFELLMNDTDLRSYDRKDLLSKLKTELDLHNVETVSVQKHSILLPPEAVIQICLKDSPILEKLLSVKKKCKSEIEEQDFKCMFGELVKGADDQINMNTLNDVIKSSEGIGPSSNILLRRTNECNEWWNVLMEVNPNSDPDLELGRCLLHTISVGWIWKLLHAGKLCSTFIPHFPLVLGRETYSMACHQTLHPIIKQALN